MLKVASATIAALAAFSPTLAQDSAATTSSEFDDGVTGRTGCPLRYQTPLHLSSWESLDHLVITVEGPDCVSAQVVFRVFDAAGEQILRVGRANVTYGSSEGPFDPLETTVASHEWLAERYLDPMVLRTSWLPAYDLEGGGALNRPDGAAGDGLDHIYPGRGFDEEVWERARAQDQPLWCFLPTTHAASCWWRDPDSDRAIELAYAVW